jgi:hypothetical protein
MSKFDDMIPAKRRIQQETDAEIAFGEFLERSGVDCDAFMSQLRIGQSQFNAISHYLYGLTDDVSMLPPALGALLMARRSLPSLAA